MLLRRSADLGWKREDLKYTRTRMIEHDDVCVTQIVPGGRWLLAGDYQGNLVAYDLHASPITKTSLIPRGGQPISFMVIDIDPESRLENLAFNLAISPLVNSGGFNTCHGFTSRLTDLC